MDINSLLPVTIQLSFGLIAGIIVGYTFKKITKLLAILLGLFFMGIQILAYYKFVSVNWEKVAEVTENAISATASTSPFWWNVLTTNFPYVATFSMGFIIGFKKG